MEVAKGVSSEPIEKINMAAMRFGLRPNRSPRLPNITAPIRPPKSPAPKTGPNSDGSRCQADAISGATKAIACVSKPSSIATMLHSAIVTTWNPLSGLASMSASRSFLSSFIFCTPDFGSDACRSSMAPTAMHNGTVTRKAGCGYAALAAGLNSVLAARGGTSGHY